MAALSPQRKSSFFAACARSAEISASAQSSAPQRGWKLGHSNIAQRGLSEQLTDRGTKQTCAAAAIAHAAISLDHGDDYLVAQHFSQKQPFKLTIHAEFQTYLSLHSARAYISRVKPALLARTSPLLHGCRRVTTVGRTAPSEICHSASDFAVRVIRQLYAHPVSILRQQNATLVGKIDNDQSAFGDAIIPKRPENIPLFAP